MRRQSKPKRKGLNLAIIRDLRDLALVLNDYNDLFNEEGLFKDPDERELTGLVDGTYVSCLSMHRLTNRDKEPMNMQKIGAYNVDYLIDGLRKLKKLGAECITISNVVEGPIEFKYKSSKKEFFYSLAPRVEDEGADEQ